MPALRRGIPINKGIKMKNQGFTLLEMLVVLVIIGLLAGLVGPKLFKQVDVSKVKTAKTQIKMLKGTLEVMRLDTGRFPSTEEGLQSLQTAPQSEQIKSLWKGPYLDEDIPLDPWNNKYLYAFPGAEGKPFALYSLGADLQVGGEGYNADLGYLPAL